MNCAVIGLGRYGLSLAVQLAEQGADVLAIDRDPALVDEVRAQVAVAVQLDSTDEREMRAQGVHEVDVAVVAIGSDFEAAALTTALVKGLGVKRVIARSTSPMRGRILRLIGADDIVSPEEEAAQVTTRRILRPALLDYLKVTEGRSVVELVAPRGFDGKSLQELNLRQRYRVSVIGIKRTEAGAGEGEGGAAERLLDPNDIRQPLRAGDKMIVVGSDEDLGRLLRAAEKEG